MCTVVDRFLQLNVWQRGSERAPHKPLLILLALGALSRGEMELSFAEYEPRLRALLKEFGPARRAIHPEYPFWRLQKDGLCSVSLDGAAAEPARSEPLLSELRGHNARGAFPASVLGSLLASPAAIAEVAQRLLDSNFPTTLHQDVLDAVGLSLDALQSSGARRRDPRFREAVLVAYQFRCAMCGLDMRIGSVTVGLEAAHIKWHQANGPDSVDNGFAYCTLHHKLFDLGAFTVAPDHRVLVSEQVNGSRSVEEALFRYHGAALTVPRRAEQLPRPEYLEWHLREVFKLNALP